MSAGLYNISIMDANGCMVQNTISVAEPPCLQVDSITSTPVSCNGGDGTATVYVSNGLGLLSYNWMTSPNQVSQQADSLSPGTYIVSVSDANGCTVNGGVTLTSQLTVFKTYLFQSMQKVLIIINILRYITQQMLL